ncbi:MAG TPA: ABC transporter ATP-binding protein, partial [Clostridia bacterium]|nr:ABC transporter ATP-binding protein [Clostridia bacterium]
SEKPFTAIVSTHLIDEVSSVIEHVVMIDKGHIIKDEPIESILSQGYTITGPANSVDLFVADKDVMSYDMLGGLKTAYVSGKVPAEVPSNLEVTKMDLQKMFIKMTNDKEVSK